jgi:opacity protein-like surface antigen
MKKVALSLLFVLSLMGAVQAQDISKAIGIRAGAGAEISYQHPLSDANRLEADLGLGGWGEHGGFLLSGLYHWVFNINNGLNWYVGPGLQLGSVYYESDNKWENGLGIGIAGQIGIEYNFDFPLQLSLDYRPDWFIIPSAKGMGYDGIALGIRYKF